LRRAAHEPKDAKENQKIRNMFDAHQQHVGTPWEISPIFVDETKNLSTERLSLFLYVGLLYVTQDIFAVILDYINYCECLFLRIF